jgi:hypothetical protein
MEKLFEIATRKKYRFPCNGLISVEDLWDLALPRLDGIYKELNKRMRDMEEDSLMASSTKDDTISNMAEIVKYIFATKQAEAAARKKAAEVAVKRQRILEFIAQKDDESMMNMSREELLKKLEELE